MAVWIPDKESAITTVVPVLFALLCEPSVGGNPIAGSQKNDNCFLKD